SAFLAAGAGAALAAGGGAGGAGGSSPVVGVCFRASRALFAPQKGLLAQKRFARVGGGGAARGGRCLEVSMIAIFFLAKAPHSRNTMPLLRLLSSLMTASVNVSQPLSLWEPASWARTVITALSSSTPCSAQAARWPCGGMETPRSPFSS